MLAEFFDTIPSTSSSDVSSDIVGPPLNHTANQAERHSDAAKYPTVTGSPPPPGANGCSCYTIMSARPITHDESVASEVSSYVLSSAFSVRLWTTDGSLAFFAFYNPASASVKDIQFSDFLFIPPATSQSVIPSVTSQVHKKARGHCDVTPS